MLWDYTADLDVQGKGQYCVAGADRIALTAQLGGGRGHITWLIGLRIAPASFSPSPKEPWPALGEQPLATVLRLGPHGMACPSEQVAWSPP